MTNYKFNLNVLEACKEALDEQIIDFIWGTPRSYTLEDTKKLQEEDMKKIKEIERKMPKVDDKYVEEQLKYFAHDPYMIYKHQHEGSYAQRSYQAYVPEPPDLPTLPESPLPAIVPIPSVPSINYGDFYRKKEFKVKMSTNGKFLTIDQDDIADTIPSDEIEKKLKKHRYTDETLRNKTNSPYPSIQYNSNYEGETTQDREFDIFMNDIKKMKMHSS